MRRAGRRLHATLGDAGLPPASRDRAIRLTGQYMRFRTWLWRAYRLPIIVLIIGEILHLSSNIVYIHRHDSIHMWRVASNVIAFVGSVVLFVVVPRLLLAASPRLVIVAHVVSTADQVSTLTDEWRDVQVDGVIRSIGRLELRLTSYYTLTHPAGDRYTRARLTAVNNGLYSQLVDLKQRLLFADSVADVAPQHVLWGVLAAGAADPQALVRAESAGSASDRVAEPGRARIVYRAAAVFTILTVIAAVVGLWYVDHTALSVVFSAIVAPLLLPAIVGLGRRGWSRSERDRKSRPLDEQVRIAPVEIDSVEVTESVLA